MPPKDAGLSVKADGSSAETVESKESNESEESNIESTGPGDELYQLFCH
jgi:YbbR domain-containing protein